MATPSDLETTMQTKNTTTETVPVKTMPLTSTLSPSDELALKLDETGLTESVSATKLQPVPSTHPLTTSTPQRDVPQTVEEGPNKVDPPVRPRFSDPSHVERRRILMELTKAAYPDGPSSVPDPLIFPPVDIQAVDALLEKRKKRLTKVDPNVDRRESGDANTT